MVFTRSQRSSRLASKSSSDSENSKENSNEVGLKNSKRRRPPVMIPSKDDTETPLPDSSSSSTALIAVCDDKDAVAIAANHERAEQEQTKGKRSRKRNRKKKLTIDPIIGQADETVTLDNTESSTSSPGDDCMNQGSDDAGLDAGSANSEPAQATASIVDETEKENALATQCAWVSEERFDAMADIPAVNIKEVVQLYKQESYARGQEVKPKGKPKSGRTWKTEQTTRFSGMKQDRPLKTSWRKKMQQKAELKNLKMFESELKEAKNDELERKKKYRAKKIKRKLENQRKSEVVQVISNSAKMKRMKKKQLRKIEMRSLPDSSKKQVFTS